MANTYTQLNVHAVFSVKNRENFLGSPIRAELHSYIFGIIKSLNNFPLAVNGYKDHVHIFFELNPSISISEIISKVKTGSTNWINTKKLMPGKFSWQNGYAAFTYSKSQRNDVINYITNQEMHHHKTTFKEEYLKLLELHQLEFDTRYLFEFYD
jgi:REP element-mobilizing transposase RayT